MKSLVGHLRPCAKSIILRTNPTIGWTISWQVSDRILTPLWIARSYATSAEKNRRWTTEEVDLLTQLKRQDATKAEILASFPHRSWNAILKKWTLIGERDRDTGRLLHTTGRRFFTGEELLTISRLSEDGLSHAQIASHLPGRTPQQVRTFYKGDWRYSASVLGSGTPLRRLWTAEDTKRVIVLRDERSLTWKAISMEMKRPSSTASKQYRKATNVVTAKASPPYTPEEESTLARMYHEGATLREIQHAFQGRSMFSVRDKIYAMQHLLRNDIRSANTRFSPEIVGPQIAAMRAEGKRWNEVAQQFPERSTAALKHLYQRWRKKENRVREQPLPKGKKIGGSPPVE